MLEVDVDDVDDVCDVDDVDVDDVEYVVEDGVEDDVENDVDEIQMTSLMYMMYTGLMYDVCDVYDVCICT